MTTVYSPAALLIIALSVLLVLVILLTVISFCVYVATGRLTLKWETIPGTVYRIPRSPDAISSPTPPGYLRHWP